MRVIELKYKIEKKFKRIKLRHDCWGYQIQPHTKFSKGISNKDIDKSENLFGFQFPLLYREMQLIFMGLDKPQISINPEDKNDIDYDYSGFFYQYPEDFEKSQLLIDVIQKNYNEAKFTLTEAGFDVSKIIGFVPIHDHRALVVFKNRNFFPVISAMGADIIMFGNNLIEYLKYEFRNR